VLLHSHSSFILDKQKSDLCVDGQYHSVYQAGKYPNLGNVMAFTKQTVGKYFCSKTNQMHNISNLFYFGTALYMFWTVSPSIIRSLRLYIYLMLYVQS